MIEVERVDSDVDKEGLNTGPQKLSWLGKEHMERANEQICGKDQKTESL